MALNIRKGDLVQVISGKDRGVKGKVIEVYPDADRVIVEGVMLLREVADLHPVAGFDRTGIGFLNSGEHAQQRSLAAARRTHQCKYLSLVDPQIDVIDRIERAVGLGHVLDHDLRLGRGVQPWLVRGRLR